MKKVIIDPIKSDTILLASISSQAIIGFRFEDQEKGWLQPLAYSNGSYRTFSVHNGISKGNGWGAYDSVNQFVRFQKAKIESGETEMYVFDTEQELFKWLSKE